jgi:hypothetical protein
MTKRRKLGGSFTLPNTSISLYRIGYGAMQLAGPGIRLLKNGLFGWGTQGLILIEFREKHTPKVTPPPHAFRVQDQHGLT